MNDYSFICFNYTDIEVSCYGYEGIDAVKNALKAGIAKSTEDLPIKVCVQLID